jgi:hypothetical protein
LRLSVAVTAAELAGYEARALAAGLRLHAWVRLILGQRGRPA